MSSAIKFPTYFVPLTWHKNISSSLNSLLDYVKELKTSLSNVKAIEDLSDSNVKQTFDKLSEWKNELLKVKESKVKFDENVICVGLEKTKTDN